MFTNFFRFLFIIIVIFLSQSRTFSFIRNNNKLINGNSKDPLNHRIIIKSADNGNPGNLYKEKVALNAVMRTVVSQMINLVFGGTTKLMVDEISFIEARCYQCLFDVIRSLVNNVDGFIIDHYLENNMKGVGLNDAHDANYLPSSFSKNAQYPMILAILQHFEVVTMPHSSYLNFGSYYRCISFINTNFDFMQYFTIYFL